MTNKQIEKLYIEQMKLFGRTVRIRDPKTPRRDGHVFVFVNEPGQGVAARLVWLWDTDDLPKGTIGWLEPHEALVSALSTFVHVKKDCFIVD